VIEPPTHAELEAAFCLDPTDVVPRRPEMTAFRQRTRLRQARWRERLGHPIGSQPYAPRPGVDPRPVGSRIDLAYGRATGGNFLTPAALEPVKARTAIVEREQSIDHQRLWADLLSSEALAFNLFGSVARDRTRADRLVRTWFADAPGRVVDVRFLHSPGRLEEQWLNSLRQFDVAFVLSREDGSHGIVAVDVTYHERLKSETPKPENLWRYRQVHERSDSFTPEAFQRVQGRSDVWSPWLEHLLLLAMLQHPSGEWTWGRYVTVHAADSVEMAERSVRYRELLADARTFMSTTIEDVLDTGALADAAVRAIRDRYLEP
jgi:hypothetical protein